jgi:hypothetical protein
LLAQVTDKKLKGFSVCCVVCDLGVHLLLVKQVGIAKLEKAAVVVVSARKPPIMADSVQLPAVTSYRLISRQARHRSSFA